MPSSDNASLIIIKLNKKYIVVIKGILGETMAVEMISNIMLVCVATGINSEIMFDRKKLSFFRKHTRRSFGMLKFVQEITQFVSSEKEAAETKNEITR